LWAALAYAAGILFGNYAWRPPLWWVVAALSFLGTSAYFIPRRMRWAFALALGALFLVGAFASQMHNPQPQQDYRVLELSGDEEVLVTGHVIREGTLRVAGFGGVRQLVDVETEKITWQGKTIEVGTGVRLAI